MLWKDSEKKGGILVSDPFTISSEIQSNSLSWRKPASSWSLVQFLLFPFGFSKYSRKNLLLVKVRSISPRQIQTVTIYSLVSGLHSPVSTRAFFLNFFKFSSLCLGHVCSASRSILQPRKYAFSLFT